MFFVHETFRKHLGFHWDNLTYVFNVLPFGLSPAPFIFTKLMRPLLTRWRSQGIGIAVYLDDGLIWAQTELQCRKASFIVSRDLESAGFFTAEEKCSWQPSQRMTWLGHTIDLSSMSLDITSERKERAFSTIASLLRSRGPILRERLKWLDTLASMHLVIPRERSKKHRAMISKVAQRVAHGCSLSYRWSLAKRKGPSLEVG